MELLQGWKAPVQDMDPWNPETFTPQRLESLKEWAAKSGKQPDHSPAEPYRRSTGGGATRDHRDAAGRHAVEAQAVRERLARYGPPCCRESMNSSRRPPQTRPANAWPRCAIGSWPAMRWRCDGRAALSGWRRSMRSFASRPPTSWQTREAGRRAAPARAVRPPGPARPRDQPASAPAIGGAETSEGMVKLLHDPEPNVRAAVLKQMRRSLRSSSCRRSPSMCAVRPTPTSWSTPFASCARPKDGGAGLFDDAPEP